MLSRTSRQRFQSASRAKINSEKQPINCRIFPTTGMFAMESQYLMSKSIRLKQQTDQQPIKLPNQTSKIWQFASSKRNSQIIIKNNSKASYEGYRSATSHIKDRQRFQIGDTRKIQIDNDISHGFQVDVIEKDKLKPQNQLTIQQSKTSTKTNGYIQSYAVNSYISTSDIFQIKEIRISIITNLSKLMNRNLNVSLYAIYESDEKNIYIDFVRENFHLLLVQEHNFDLHIEESVKIVFEKIQSKFSKQIGVPRNKQYLLNTNISFVIALCIQKSIYILTRGNSHFIISTNFGQNIIKSQKPNAYNKEKTKMIKLFTILNNETIDFILLGSKFISIRQIDGGLATQVDNKVQHVWKAILSENMRSNGSNSLVNLHLQTGEFVDSLMRKILKVKDCNLSIILLRYKNSTQIQTNNNQMQQLCLPFIN